jgi:hypothetical protein
MMERPSWPTAEAGGHRRAECEIIEDEQPAMAKTVPSAQAVDQEIGELERQIQNLQRKLDGAIKSRPGTTQPADTAVPRQDRNLQRLRSLRKDLWPYLREYGLLAVLTAPVIYSTILALLVLDVFLTLYQWICFPVYGIEKVKRRDFIVFDHHHLTYLNAIEKFNCAFCSYANGLLAYSVEIGSRTEAFWCPIKHAKQTQGLHLRAEGFVSYMDGVGYRQKQKENAKTATSAAQRMRQCSICRKRGEPPCH